MNDIEDESDLKILVELWKHPSITRLHLTGDNSFERHLEHKMSCWTNTLLGLFFVSVFIMMLCFGLCGFGQMSLLVVGGVGLLLIGLGISICGPLLTIQILCKQWRWWKFWKWGMVWRLWGKLKEKDVKDTLRQYVNPEQDTAHPNAYWLWQRVVLLDIFGYRFVWWWVLIIGVVSVFVKNWNPKLSKVFEGDTGSELMVVFLTSVFAFIATNVIRELIVVRVRSQYSADKVEKATSRVMTASDNIATQTESVENKIGGFSKKISDMLDTMCTIANLGEMQAATVQIVTKIKNAVANESKKDSLKQMNIFVRYCTEQTENYIRLVNTVENKPNLIKCLLPTLNKYMEEEKRLLNHKQQRIITSHAVLGTIAENIVSSFFPENNSGIDGALKETIEFYGLMAMKPLDFLKRANGDNKEDTKKWRIFINANKTYAEKGIKQNRYFIAIESEGDSSQKLPLQKQVDLHYASICSDLKDYYVKTDESGNPIFDEDKGFTFKKTNRKNSDSKWKSLAKVLFEDYHASCCFIRKMSIDVYKKHFSREYIRGLQYPLDYFAVKHAEHGWLFCLETVYNDATQIADISICYESANGKNDWEKTKNDLDYIFGNNGVVQDRSGEIIRLDDSRFL